MCSGSRHQRDSKRVAFPSTAALSDQPLLQRVVARPPCTLGVLAAPLQLCNKQEALQWLPCCTRTSLTPHSALVSSTKSPRRNTSGPVTDCNNGENQTKGSSNWAFLTFTIGAGRSPRHHAPRVKPVTVHPLVQQHPGHITQHRARAALLLPSIPMPLKEHLCPHTHLPQAPTEVSAPRWWWLDLEKGLRSTRN